MRPRLATALAAFAGMLLLAAPAGAAVPSIGPISATNIQGVSALLAGSVDPQGLATSYRFEYIAEPAFAAGGFAGAIVTPASPVGAGSGDHPARAAISGLSPSTDYRYRLVATNSSGTVTSPASAFSTTAGFGFLSGTEGFDVSAIADGGEPATAAGSHPYQLGIGVGLKLGGEFEGQPGVPFSDGDLRDLRIELPPGFLLNPAALDKCSPALFGTPRSSPFEASRSGERCPDSTQVGTVEVASSRDGGEPRRFGLFNLDPPPGVAAQLGFAPYGVPVVLDALIRESAEGYAITLQARNLPQSLDLHGLDVVLWGTPWGASHNGERGNCLNEAEPDFPWAKCSVGPPATFKPQAYLTLPIRCSGPLAFRAKATSWQQPAEVSTEALNRDAFGDPADLTSCADLQFTPTPNAFLTDTKASSPSGFNFRLQNDHKTLTEPFQPAQPQPRQVVVRLPQGVSVNPSVGAGLGTCSPAQFEAETAFNGEGEGCPNAANIGDFRVRSPLFETAFEGAVYLATPNDPAFSAPGAENPFDTLVAVYLVAKLPERGVMIRLAGKIVPDPVSGDLTATFDDLPQLPYTDLDLNFRAGQRSFLVTPAACGPATTRIEMTPWADGLAPSDLISNSSIDSGVGGGPCPAPGLQPFAPGAVTGAYNSNVGSYTPYFIHLSRQDTEQEITSYSLVLPKGITAKLAGIPFCSEPAIAAARSRSGFAETADPSCPAASEVGHTLTGYGVGSALTYAPGRVYLAGPYNGRPLSLVTVNAATVGPFDLGTIVIRSAFALDEHTAQLEIDSRASDPIPHIIKGILLHLRDIRVYMDRPQFTHNPSSCEPSQLVSTLTGSGATFGDPGDDSVATVSRHFQLLNCLTLGFRPKLGLRLRGGSHRGDYPSLRATFAARGPQDSNLKGIGVTMPHALFLAQEHIDGICTRPQFDAERCPRDAEYGKAVAYTPLFDEPLRGSVYLRSSANPLPDLVASLRSGSIHVVLEGKIGSSKQGGIRVQFEGVPDAPIDRFTMTLFGGKRGLMVNSTNVCANPPLASVKALGQNNLGAVFTTKLRGQCKAKKTHHKGGRR
jgi:hypothetical protein